MTHEIKRIDPLRAANVIAIVYGVLTGVIALLFVPFWILMLAVIPAAGNGEAGLAGVAGGAIFAILMLIVYPIMGAVMGWIMGGIGSFIYNLVVGWIGGLRIEVERVEPAGPVEPVATT